MVIDGRKIAGEILARLKKCPASNKFLAVILVGDDPASASFVKQKENVARALGVDFRVIRLPQEVSEADLRAKVEELTRDDSPAGGCGGVILQLPLPAHINRDRVIAAIPFEKDADNLRGGDLVLSPAAGVVEEILKIVPTLSRTRDGIGENCKIENLSMAVVGLGFLVGKPITAWLKGKARELLTLDVSDDLARLKDADVVILGVGKAGLVRPEMLKDGALVIDFGYSRAADGKLHGDFSASQIGNWKPARPAGGLEIGNLRYTPVPHGTGPILVAKLFENFYVLNPE
ncbi:MAG: bifunctional 5,10-methylenetetrahydrofolate dehydrogenase/5,10-methenyltetrahydrofolate cyclohydrolase [Candidatus Brennerbacteria bacterium]|nr:bifunctional 5,10-methylenetetrahydrofolate dehydrogenase/5,10-methenyltetrahydrofolate cyclohydrolase [Candidatus Brennerbacteria bacterium]